MSTLLSRYPIFLRRASQFVDFQDALDPERQALWDAYEDFGAQLNVDTATWGLQYWEQALGIAVDVSKNVEYRRSVIKSKLRGAGTTTVAMIQNTAQSYSNGEVEVTEEATQYAIKITFVGTLGVPPNLDDLTNTLKEIMPAHLRWEYIMIFNTWQAVASHTWGSVAGMTWQELKESELDANIT